MTDILDGTVAEIKSTRLSVVEARALIEAEKAGKTRKGVIAHLEEIVASAPTAPGAAAAMAAGAGTGWTGPGNSIMAQARGTTAQAA